MSQRSRARRTVSLGLGLILMLSGLAAFLYMFLTVVEPLTLLIWFIPITVFAAGLAIVWDDFRNP